jgi:hypothetical protein
MQRLLGKIASLDPDASQSLRVIACFDELTVGNVNTRGLLSAAAALAGCDAGFRSEDPARTIVATPDGEVVPFDGPVPAAHARTADGMTVWLARGGRRHANDDIILERLALAVRIRNGHAGHRADHRRELAIVLDEATDAETRRTAAVDLGLTVGVRHRVLVAPLFAVWTAHPAGPEDVVATPFGPVHALVVHRDVTTVAASPVGIGVAAPVERLDHSFRTGLVALRLCEPPARPVLCADDEGALIALLADASALPDIADVDALDAVMAHAWGRPTLDALVRAGSLREAARIGGVHHSTMQARVDVLCVALGYDPTDGLGRARLGTAFAVWRLRHSRVLDLPAPARRRAG